MKPLSKYLWLLLPALVVAFILVFGRTASTQAAMDERTTKRKNLLTPTTPDVANEKLNPPSTSPVEELKSVEAKPTELPPRPPEIIAPEPLPPSRQVIPIPAALVEKRVTVMDLLAEALQNNFDIEVKRLDTQVETDRLRQARGAFNPTFNVDVRYDNQETPQNAQELASTGGATTDIQSGKPRIFFEKDWKVKASLEGRLPTGTKYNVFSQLNVLDNLLNQTSPLSLFTPEYQSQTGITLTQPLLRDFGTDVNLSEIRVARKNQLITNLELKALVLSTVANVITAYLDLAHSVEEVHLKDEECRLAERLIKERTDLLERGLVTTRDLSRAESAYAESVEELTLARVRAVEKQTELYRLTARSPDAERRTLLAPSEIKPISKPSLQRDTLLAEAFQNRPEYLAAKQRVEREQIKLVFAQNQIWPRLDLQATYGVNGLAGASFARSYNRAFDGQGPFWGVGVQFSVPIGNDDAIGRKNLAIHQKEQSILGLHQAERETILALDQNLTVLDAQYGRLQAMRVFRENSRASLGYEEERLEKGLASELDVLKFRRDFSEARTKEIAALADCHKALVKLYEITGTLLEKQNIFIGPKS